MQWLTQIQSLINDYWQWLIGIAGLSAILSWIPGGGAAIAILTSALRVAASAIEAAAPIISAIFSGFIWIWQKILLPGILDIIDSWATIFTILIAGTIGWFIFVSKYEVSQVQTNYSYNQCKKELQSCTKRAPPKEPEVELQLPWPFDWKW